ncbi:YeeE/YedE family protein [Geminicoccus roseus]|uniref:YeeE/YedE family protein n=1 Tax=Geminicoccus roseus TaxID=404900 RepID=UPI000402427C|nr:hypothetical protein [Geminicoccus roseus]
MSGYLPSLLGGMLIGVAVAMLMLLNGRIAGISGIAAGLLRRPDRRMAEDLAFVGGLLLGPLGFLLAFGAWPLVRIEGSLPVLALAGILVGFGSRLGSGCTSGHGVAGLARLSPRSIAAVLVFLATAILTVSLMRSFGS